MTWPIVKLCQVAEIDRDGIQAGDILSGTAYLGLELSLPLLNVPLG